MIKTRITKIEQAVDKLKADQPDRQAATDQVLHDLHKIYGDQNLPTPKMDWWEFDEMVEQAINKTKS